MTLCLHIGSKWYYSQFPLPYDFNTFYSINEIENIYAVNDAAIIFSGFIIVLLRSILNYPIGWKHINVKGVDFEE